MGQTNYWKIFAFFAFVVFAAVSCWATVESLYLTLEDAEVPKWIFWVAVVGLFVLTSYCTKVIVDSLNQNIFLEHRGVRLTFGVLGVLVLWLCFSMPTNSHTFFYKKMAKNVAKQELTFIRDNVGTHSDKEKIRVSCQTDFDNQSGRVKNSFEMFAGEIKQYRDPGLGPHAQGYWNDMVRELSLTDDGDREILENFPKSQLGRHNNIATQNDKNAFIRTCEDKMNVYLDLLKNKCFRRLDDYNNNADNIKKAAAVEALKNDIQTALEELDNDEYSKEEVLKKARKLIHTGYSEDPLLVETYDGYQSERLTNVTKVWGDYLGGEFSDKNYGLIYWILLSVLVDIAAFVFFSIAFKKS